MCACAEARISVHMAGRRPTASYYQAGRPAMRYARLPARSSGALAPGTSALRVSGVRGRAGLSHEPADRVLRLQRVKILGQISHPRGQQLNLVAHRLVLISPWSAPRGYSRRRDRLVRRFGASRRSSPRSSTGNQRSGSGRPKAQPGPSRSDGHPRPKLF